MVADALISDEMSIKNSQVVDKSDATAERVEWHFESWHAMCRMFCTHFVALYRQRNVITFKQQINA